MFIGRVVGTLWATRKTENTQGLKFLIVQPYNLNNAPNTDTVVVADTLDAGEGDVVMVGYGRAARLAVGNEDVSIEAAVVGIIDEFRVDKELYHGDLDETKSHYKK